MRGPRRGRRSLLGLWVVLGVLGAPAARTVSAAGDHADRAQALALLAQGRDNEALPFLDAALARHPRDIELRNRRGNLHLRHNRPDLALVDFDEAARFSPFLAYDAADFQRQFAPDVERMLGSPRYWGPQFKPSVFHNRGIAHLMLGHDEPAMADFRHAMDLRRSFRSWTGAGRDDFRRGQAASLEGIGQVYLRKRNPEQALDAFTEALQFDPQAANALVGRGQAFAELGRWDDAIGEFDRALQIDPNHARARGFRADVLGRVGRSDDSLRAFDDAAGSEPPSAALRQRRAAHLARLGRFDEALSELDEARRLSPNDASIYKDRGGLYNQKGEPARALDELNLALRLDPNNARALQNRAASLNALGRYEDAIRDADAALRLEPGNAGALNNRGLARTALGRLDEAIADFTAALQLNPKLAPAYLNRAGALTRLERHDDAAADYADAVRLEPRYAALMREPSKFPDLVRIPRTNGTTNAAALRQGEASDSVGDARLEGDLCRVAGDWPGAVAAYSRALRAAPSDSTALVLRGWSRLIGGETGAAEDVRAWFGRSGAGWRDPLAPSVALLGILADRREGRQAAADRLLDEAIANTPPTRWPAPVLTYLKRTLGEEELLSAAVDPEQQSLAHAIIGVDLLGRGYREAAIDHLRQARDRGDDRSVARDLARETLARATGERR